MCGGKWAEPADDVLTVKDTVSQLLQVDLWPQLVVKGEAKDGYPLGSTKAIGVDGLPCSFWKQFCDDLAPFVNVMVNTSVKTGTYPTLFKDAIVVPVFKGGRKDREDPASYRPISVLPAISKVLEAIIIDQFLDYLDEYNLLPPAQHGFRQGHSTVTALVKTRTIFIFIARPLLNGFDESRDSGVALSKSVLRRREKVKLIQVVNELINDDAFQDF